MTNGNSNPPATTSVPQMMPSGPVTAVTTGTLIMDTYEIEKLINSGGMGEVYRGRNIHNGEPVAIKIVLPSLAHDPKIVALFQKESTVLSRLSHEAIVRYHTFTIDRSIGRPCMVMEFVSGLPLGDRVEQGPMPLDEVKVMFRRVASGLDKAHRAGVVHRDLSPDNVILEEGSVDHAKLIDFGIAKSASFGGGTLLGGQFAGKFNWVAPEQLGAFGGLVDGRSDIYSLALVVAAASRGKVVAMGDSIVDAVGKRSGVPDLTGVDPELLPLLSYMLQPDPANRPESMAAVIAALDNPALVPRTTPAAPDPNRTVIGGTLPIAPESYAPPPSSMPPTAAAPLPVSPMPSSPATGTADWSMPSARPMTLVPPTTSPATIIAPQVPVSQPPAPLMAGPAAEPEDISPFGAPSNAAARPAAVATPVSSPAPAKKSSSGMLVVVGLLVVGGGAAGAYFGGLIGGPAVPTEEQLVVQDAAEAQAAIEAAKVAADKAAADRAAADQAAAAEAEAKAAADKAAADQAAAAQAAAEADGQKQAEADRLAAEAQARAEAEAAAKAAEEASNQTAEEQAAAQKAAEVAAAEAAAAAKLAEEAAAREAAEKAAADQAAAEAEAAAKAEAEAAAKAAQAAAELAAAETGDPLAAQLAWLQTVSTPACVHLRPAAGAGPLTLDGYATATGPLEDASRALTADLKREADIAPRLINEAQCPVIEFAKSRQSSDVPALTVRRDATSDVVKSGGKITLVVEGINGRPFSIFLFSDAGGATNLKPFATQASDGSASFTFTLSMAAGAPPAPQVVLVMATEAPLTKLDAVPNGVTAKSLMPFIEVALKDNTGPTALGMGFFRLEN